ncbi:MAG: hypothetical protein RIR16_181 [Actinomycetota bacterium]|jgi:peptidoglycan/LPS O-acetylase OafA/YrhL
MRHLGGELARRLRADIQALRAIAVLAVIFFHLWPAGLTGGFIGVDVFFVISGFLITSHILNDMERGRFTVVQFWARRVRRLLPASFAVILVSSIAVMALARDSEQVTLLWESIAATFYFENWALAASAVDYLRQDNSTSPVQHFWSLSVEEQFYFVWPLLLLVALGVWALLKKRIEIRWFALPILLILVVSSLIYSIYLTDSDPKVAYFSTFVRAWEFGAGALVASLPGRDAFNAPKLVRQFAAVAGFALIAYSALSFDEAMPFPSYWAAIPVAGTALVIWSNIHHGLMHRIMALKPVQYLGDISYSAYLWHWPPIILLPLIQQSELGNLDKIVIFVGTLFVAAFSRRFIEKPFIKTKTSRPSISKKTLLATALASVLVAGIAGAGLSAAQNRIDAELAELAKAPVLEKCFGATARMADGELCENPQIIEPITPKAELASQDHPRISHPDCPSTNREETEVRLCSIGTPGGKLRILLIGDSHAAQFRTTLGVLAENKGWQFDSASKGGCALSYAARVQDSLLTESCRVWVANVLAKIAEKKYDLVVTSSLSGVTWSKDPRFEQDPVKGFADIYRAINAMGTDVLVVKDNPRPVKKLSSCILKNEKTWPTDCAVSPETAFLDDPLPEAVAQVGSTNTKLLSLDNIYCGPASCEPVIGKVLVYRDDNHISNTFAKTLQVSFFEAIQAFRAAS